MASDAFKQKLLAQARAIHTAALKQNQKKKLQDYIRASSGDATHRQNVANFTKTTDSKVAARNAGQQRAQTRLTKLGEDVASPGQIVKVIKAPKHIDVLPGDSYEVRTSDKQGVTLKHGLGTKYDDVKFPHGSYSVAKMHNEDVSSVITNGEDRRKYTALRAMQSVRSDLAKKAKPITAQAHQRMAQQHADDAEAILDKYRKESSDMCNVCGQTPCNCTSIDEGVLNKIANKIMGAQPETPAYKKGQKVTFQTTLDQPSWKGRGSGKGTITDTEGYSRHGHYLVKTEHGETHAISHHDIKKVHESVDEALSSVQGVSGKRTTMVQRAIRRAQKTPQEVAMVNNSVNPYVEGDLIDEAKVPSGLTWTGSELKKRPELVAAAARRKSYKAYLKRKAAKEQPETKVDESSDKLYAGYQADVLSLKAKAKKQEQERGPVDIQKLAARLRAVKLKGNQK